VEFNYVEPVKKDILDSPAEAEKKEALSGNFPRRPDTNAFAHDADARPANSDASEAPFESAVFPARNDAAPAPDSAQDPEHHPEGERIGEPHPTTAVGKVAKVAVEVMALDHSPSDWSLIVQSAAAGTLSAIVTLPACQIAAQYSQTLADPAWNAAFGVLVSAATYVPTFIGISLYRARKEIAAFDAAHRATLVKDKIVHGLKFLGLQEFCEYAARYGMHVGLMSAGLEPWSAFAIASAVTGFLGRVSTPWFSRLFKKKDVPPAAETEGGEQPGAENRPQGP
jgi:hypothetical protein